jgi:hypothetical protein
MPWAMEEQYKKVSKKKATRVKAEVQVNLTLIVVYCTVKGIKAQHDKCRKRRGKIEIKKFVCNMKENEKLV